MSSLVTSDTDVATSLIGVSTRLDTTTMRSTSSSKSSTSVDFSCACAVPTPKAAMIAKASLFLFFHDFVPNWAIKAYLYLGGKIMMTTSTDGNTHKQFLLQTQRGD